MRLPTWLTLPAFAVALSACATDFTLFSADEDERPAQRGSWDVADDTGAVEEDQGGGTQDGGTQDGGSEDEGGSTGGGSAQDGGTEEDGGSEDWGSEEDGGSWDTGWEDEDGDGGSLDEPEDGGSEAGETGDGGSGEEAYTLAVGDLVITELMIDPTAVSDADGEWVEVYNAGPSPVQLQGMILGDEGVDAWPLEDELTIAPGAYAVLCASTSANGGVSCDGSFHYNTWGEGFALSNGGDEVVLTSTEGEVIDRVSYSEDDVVPGSSQGLDPFYTSAEHNDYSEVWCAQESAMSGGDDGTPGSENDTCW